MSCVFFNIGFGAIGKGPNDNIFAIVTAQNGRHGLEGAAIKHVQKKSFDNVIPMMAKGDFGDAIRLCIAIQSASAKSGAKAAHGFSLRNYAFDYAIGIALNNVIFDAQLLKVIRENVLGKVGLFLVEVNGDNVEVDRSLMLQGE